MEPLDIQISRDHNQYTIRLLESSEIIRKFATTRAL